MRLTNFDISEQHKDRTYWLMKSNVLGAFAYWVTAQSPYYAPDITPALVAFDKYLSKVFIAENFHKELPREFTYHELGELIHENVFEKIQEIEILNHPKVSVGVEYANRHNVYHPDFDFIDLGALARNIFYMILREQITQE